MSGHRPIKFPNKLASLFDVVLNGQATPEEMASLGRLLREDPEARKAYMYYTDMEMELKRRLSYSLSDSSPSQRPALKRHPRTRAPLAAQIDLDDVAIITRLQNASLGGSHEHLQVGDRLKPGILQIHAGVMQLAFLSGAEVVVQGPAELRLASPMKVFLARGRVSTRVPDPARGFTIATRKHSVIDLGTQVSVGAENRGDVQAYVHEGAVQFNFLDRGGATFRNQMLTEQERLIVGRNNPGSVETGDFSKEFPSLELPEPTALPIGRSYVNAVLESEPLLYWRFEGIEPRGMIRNEVGNKYHGKISGEIELFGDAGNKAFYQRDGDAGAVITSTEPLIGVNRGAYTAEMWVEPLEFRQAALASLIDPTPREAGFPGCLHHYHLMYLELVYVNSGYVHPANSFRFLHRWPPGTERNVGVNIFVPGYVPGRWTHVVAVKTPREQLLYLNGELAGRHAVEQDAIDPADYLFVVGRLDPLRNERGLTGLLDEVAMYPRALSPEEIRRHYRLGRP